MTDPRGRAWQRTAIADDIACEDLRLADMNGDGRLDVVASGRATHNLVVYYGRP